MDVFTPIGLIKAQIPTTASKLNKFEPTTLPSAISFWPLNAAVILTAASGALCSKGNNRQSNNKTWNFEKTSYGRTSAYKKICPLPKTQTL